MGLGLLGLLELSIHAKYTRCKYEKMFQTKSTDILLFYSFLITFATLHYFFYYNRHGSFKLFHYASPSSRCLSTPLSLSSAKNELFFFLLAPLADVKQPSSVHLSNHYKLSNAASATKSPIPPRSISLHLCPLPRDAFTPLGHKFNILLEYFNDA